MALPALDDDFEVQAPVVRGGDGIGKPGPDRVVRVTQSSLEDPAWANFPADFLVIREVQFQHSIERMAS